MKDKNIIQVPIGFPVLDAMEERDEVLQDLIFFSLLMSLVTLCIIVGVKTWA